MNEEHDYPALVWSARTRNAKTGDIPTAKVGTSYEETAASCEGCPLFPTKRCYAFNGTPRLGAASIDRAIQRRGLEGYSLERALSKALRSAKYVRVTSIGDAGRADPESVKAAHDRVRAKGLGWLAYSHFPEEVLENGLEDLFCVSLQGPDVDERYELPEGCETVFEAVDYWLDRGFSRAAVVVPETWSDAHAYTPDGRRGVWCPASRTKNEVTCNTCGLCDPQHKGADFVMFPDHGPQARARKRAAERRRSEE